MEYKHLHFDEIYLGITISFIIGIIFNIDNILNCSTTYNYQVWTCNVNSQLILTIGLGILWLVMTSFHLISLFCIGEE